MIAAGRGLGAGLTALLAILALGPTPARADDVPAGEPASAQPASPAFDDGAITVGTVINGTSGGVAVGPTDQVRQRLLRVLAERDFPTVEPASTQGADIDPGDARFVLNGLVTQQACHRESHWAGCRWRVEWSLFDRLQDRIVLESRTVGEASVAQNMPTTDMYVDILARAVLPLTRAPEFRALVFEADAESRPTPVGWARDVAVRRCARAPLTLPADVRALQPSLFTLPTTEGRVDGVLISPDGLGITRARPLLDADTVRGLLADDREVQVRVLRIDATGDLALVSVEGAADACAPVAAASEVPALGAPAFALGTRGDDGWGLRQGTVEGRLASPVGPRLETSAALTELSPGAVVYDAQGRVAGLSLGEGGLATSASNVMDRLGLYPDDATASLAGLDRRPARGAPVRVDFDEGAPLLAPVGPGRALSTVADVPGGTEIAIGGTMIAFGAIVAVPAALIWAAEENSFGITTQERLLYGGLTCVGIGLGIGGAALLNRGLRRANEAELEVVLGPSQVGVRGRF